MVIISSINAHWFRCWSWSCRRCCSCLNNFTIWMAIVPSYIWISRITPRFFITIWTWTIILQRNYWLVIRRMRPVAIPSLASLAVLRPVTITYLRRLWNILTIWMTFLFANAWFGREAIRCEVIVQFAKIMSSISNVFIIEWTLNRVVNLSYHRLGTWFLRNQYYDHFHIAVLSMKIIVGYPSCI